MKNKTYFKSIRCAINGMIYAFKTEKNFKWHGLIGLIFMIMNLLNHVDKVYWIGFWITAIGVFSSELINTAVEHTLNIISLDIRNDIKIAKDIGAGMVLCWGIGFFIVEMIALI